MPGRWSWTDAAIFIAFFVSIRFAFIWLDGGTVSVKCGRDAAEAGEWRARYPE